MESYKDVIVSQPPAMYAQSNFTTQISVENYKGILLCERPSTLSSNAGGIHGRNGSNAPPFVPANPISSPLGCGPSRESRTASADNVHQHQRAQRQRQRKSREALSRHRNWLRSFAKQMKTMKESERQQHVSAAQQAARLRETQARRHQEQLQQQQPMAELAARAASPCNGRCCPAANAQTRGAAAAPSRKPKWAMTEDEALEDDLQVDKDLLDFANELDYDKFISDFEVAEALAVMRDRIEQIARANDWSVDELRRAAAANELNDRNDDVESSVTPSEVRAMQGQAANYASRDTAIPGAEARPAMAGGAAQHTHDWDSSTGRCRLLRKAVSQDAIALAERLFAASPSLQKTYTKHSLARALQQCALSGYVDVTPAMLVEMGGHLNQEEKTAAASKAPVSASPPPPPAPLAARVRIAEPPVSQVSSAKKPEPVAPQTGPAVVITASRGGAGGVEASVASPTRILRDLQQSKERVQGLPYLYRCPAI